MGQGNFYDAFADDKFFQYFGFLEDRNVPNMGHVYVFQHKDTQQKCFVQTCGLSIIDQADAVRYLDRIAFQHKYILDIYNCFDVNTSELSKAIKASGNTSKAPLERGNLTRLLVFEYFEKTLDDEVNEFNNEAKRYSEKALWQMAQQLFSALATCQEHGIPVNDLNTSRILIDTGDDYQISVCQPIISWLAEKNSSVKYFKQNVFDLGRTLLHVSNMSSRKQGEKTKKYPTPDEEEMVEDMKQFYSPEWVNFIEECLIDNIKDRPDPLSIYSTGNGTLCVKMAHRKQQRMMQQPQQPQYQSFQQPQQPYNPYTYNPYNPYTSQYVPQQQNLRLSRVHENEERNQDQLNQELSKKFPYQTPQDQNNQQSTQNNIQPNYSNYPNYPFSYNPYLAQSAYFGQGMYPYY